MEWSDYDIHRLELFLYRVVTDWNWQDHRSLGEGGYRLTLYTALNLHRDLGALEDYQHLLDKLAHTLEATEMRVQTYSPTGSVNGARLKLVFVGIPHEVIGRISYRSRWVE
jgi:hypothetical protein